ncbi:MAG: hypothetical protein KAY24_20030 [Candidatus Eisenbacteria sp.]|nr:hypothetical protein [Candidatus Eisenbacteria bacterium]
MEDKKRGPRIPDVKQIWNDLHAMKNKVESLAITVSKLKEMLNTTDSWHKRIATMIGKKVLLVTESDQDPIQGILLYSDRYTMGIEVGGTARLYNKGKVEYIQLAL